MKQAWAILLLIALLGQSCKKEAFQLEGEWLTPLFRTTLGVHDLIPDSMLNKDSEGMFELVVEHEETLDSLLEVLEVPDSLSEVSLSLSQLMLEDRAFSDTVTLVEIYPQAILVHGQTTVLPAQDFSNGESTEIDVTEQFFTSATFQEGYLDIEIHNDLPVEVELIEFELLNKSDLAVIVQDQFTQIQPGSSQFKTYDLAGKTVEGVMLAELKRVKTAASNGAVTIDAFKGLRLDLSVRGLRPSKATAIFPAQDLIQQEEETTYNFGGPQITTMRLKSGRVLMEVYSSVNEEIILEYTVPQSKHVTTGLPIVKEFRIPPATNGVPSKVDEEIEIGEYEITYKGKDINNPPFYNTFYSILNARIEYTGEERTLSLDDSIYIKFGLIDVKPSLAIGDFGQRTYTFLDPMNVRAFQDVAGRLQLADARLDLSFINSFGIQSLLEIDRIEGYNSREDKRIQLIAPELSSPIFLDRAYNRISYIEPYARTISLDASNSNFKLFFQNLPNRIEPSFKVTTRPYGSNNLTDFAFDSSYLKARLSLHIPMEFNADSFGLVKTEAFNFSKEKQGGVRSGTLFLLVNNGFPLDAHLKLEFQDDDGQILLSRMADQPIRSGDVDPTSRKVREATESKAQIPLSGDDLFLLYSARKVRITALFDSPSALNYPIYDSYRIDMVLSAKFIYETD